jgi:hypothetical protein
VEDVDGDGATGSSNHKCDCASAFSADERYAGKFCQYSSTDLCTKNPDTTSGRSTNNAFCVNNGICKARIEDGESHPGCNCPDGYEGEHCEFIKGKQPSTGGTSTGPFTSSTTSNDDSKNLKVGIAVSLFVVAAIGGLLVMRALIRSLCCPGGTKGTSPNEIGSAVAEATTSSYSDGAISSNGPKLFEDDSDEVEDYANSIPNSGSYEEKDMSDVQIV